MRLEVARSVFSAVAILIALYQIQRSNRQSKTVFEDTISKEYRDLVRGISVKLYIGDPIAENEMIEVRHQLFRYFELTNYQIFLRRCNRISSSTWLTWRDGIQANMKLPVIQKTWDDMAGKNLIRFHNLERLIEEKYAVDPIKWNSNFKQHKAWRFRHLFYLD
jgi:hypothetical protein